MPFRHRCTKRLPSASGSTLGSSLCGASSKVEPALSTGTTSPVSSVSPFAASAMRSSARSASRLAASSRSRSSLASRKRFRAKSTATPVLTRAMNLTKESGVSERTKMQAMVTEASTAPSLPACLAASGSVWIFLGALGSALGVGSGGGAVALGSASLSSVFTVNACLGTECAGGRAPCSASASTSAAVTSLIFCTHSSLSSSDLPAMYQMSPFCPRTSKPNSCGACGYLAVDTEDDERPRRMLPRGSFSFTSSSLLCS
mmetsp:Transcript_14166/g.53230  ORF Transcript_14166/g.53230 Transcript_14166/m.53230 type:complete len:259 (+) Transcript_14166:979-1755(+)